jgi:hypothetical protein
VQIRARRQLALAERLTGGRYVDVDIDRARQRASA